MNSSNDHTYEFGRFRMDPSEHILLRDGQIITLTPKAFDILLLLVARAGHVVDKDELLMRVWGETFVEETNLTKNISLLRKMLGADDEGASYIETIPKRGYRFVAPVREIEVDRTGNATDPGGLGAAKFGKRRILSIAAVSAIGLIGLSVWFYFGSSSNTGQIKSIAVMPFVDTSGNPDTDYFADGMTVALITELSKIGELRVISRTSVMQYKAARKPLPEIARELNVDAIVEGSVIRSGERVRITAQLIRAATDQHLWAEGYERDLRDVLSLQSEVARAIASEINVKVTPQEQVLLAKARPVNPEALEAYLKGRDYSNRGFDTFGQRQGAEYLKTSIDYFEQAARIDPSYAMAYAGAAGVGSFLAANGSPEFSQPAKEAARRALEIDETLAEAHGALAFLKTFDRDFAGAEREYSRAIELNPSYADVRAGFAVHLYLLGRSDEAIREINLAQELDPLSMPFKATAGIVYLIARQPDRALEQFRRLLEIQPNNSVIRLWLCQAYIQKGMYNEAIAELRKYSDQLKVFPTWRLVLARAYALSGDRSEAARILDEELNRLAHGERVPMIGIALVYTALGDRDQAFEWLEKAHKERPAEMLFLKAAPAFDSLRSDPRYEDLLRRIGFPS